MPIPPAASYISGPLQPQLLHIVLYASALLKYENHIPTFQLAAWESILWQVIHYFQWGHSLSKSICWN